MTVREYKERIAELENEVEELKSSLCNARAEADYRHTTWDSGYAVGFNDGRRSAENNEKAEWVKVDKSGLRCSKCGSIFRQRGGTRIPKHCPECGTKTIGVE